MGLFGRKKPEIIDWTENMRRKHRGRDNLRSDTANDFSNNNHASGGTTSFPFFGESNPSSSSSSESPLYNPTYSSSPGESPEEKRRKLGKRLLDMTNKIEELTNQVYQLQQRVELIERRLQRGIE